MKLLKELKRLDIFKSTNYYSLYEYKYYLFLPLTNIESKGNFTLRTQIKTYDKFIYY